MTLTYRLFSDTQYGDSGAPQGTQAKVNETLTIDCITTGTTKSLNISHKADNVSDGTIFQSYAESTCFVYIPHTRTTPNINTLSSPVNTNTNFSTTFKVQGQGYVWGKYAFGSKEAYKTIEVSYYVINCPSEGYVFVDTSTGPQKAILLPSPSDNKKLLFIKDKSWNAATNNIKVIAPSGVNIDDANTFTINSNGGCLTLVCDGTQYWVANYYPSNRQFSLKTSDSSDITESNKIANASINTINVFSADTPTDKSSDRRNGSNLVILPSPTSGAICIIVYTGSRQALFIDSTESIDNTYTSTNAPYIYTDADYKSCGVVFISNGSTWFTAGWMYGDYWAWNADSPGSWQDIPSGDACLFMNTFRNQILYSVSTPCLKIIKVKHSDRQCYSVKDANNSGITDVYLNTSNSTSNHCLAYHGGNQNSCVWFACVPKDGNTYYYPIIGYTPN